MPRSTTTFLVLGPSLMGGSGELSRGGLLWAPETVQLAASQWGLGIKAGPSPCSPDLGQDPPLISTWTHTSSDGPRNVAGLGSVLTAAQI